MGHDTVLKARTAAEGELLGLPFAANTHPMWVVGRVSRAFLDVNNAAVQQYGYSRQELLNMTTLEIRPKADIPELPANTQSATARPKHGREVAPQKLRTGPSSRLRSRAGS